MATIAQFNPVTYAVVLVRSMMSGYIESSSAALSIVILGGFVVAMTLLASYVFTREVNKPFWEYVYLIISESFSWFLTKIIKKSYMVDLVCILKEFCDA